MALPLVQGKRNTTRWGSVSVESPTWETDFYTPPVLRGAAFFDSSAPAVYKN